MSILIDAVFENGVIKPKQPLDLHEGTEVRVEVTPIASDQDPLDAVIGICTEGPDFSLAERHDEILYGLKRTEPDSP